MLKKICPICKKEKVVNEQNFNKSKNTKSGFYPYCKICSRIKTTLSYQKHIKKRREAIKRYSKKNKKKLKVYYQNYRNTDIGRYNYIKCNAKRRKKEFTISFDDYLELIWNKRCWYCNGFTVGGMDRVDSSKGYVFGNLVPCCESCNNAKMDKSLDDFINYILRCAKYLRNNKNKIKKVK